MREIIEYGLSMKYKWLIASIISLSASATLANTMNELALGGYEWTGFYIGPALGGIWDRFRGPVSAEGYTFEGVSYPASAYTYPALLGWFAGGGQGGYLWQRDQLVLGAEVSVLSTQWRYNYTLRTYQILNSDNIFAPGDFFSSHIRCQGALVGKIGLSIQKILFYALGGVAVTQPVVSVHFIAPKRNGLIFPATVGEGAHTLVGGTGGLGIEHALSERWRVGFEYRYSAYGRSVYATGRAPVAYAVDGSIVSTPVSANMSLNTDQLLLRLNYRV